jgi:Tripartite tricarboxylate transporter TctA family
VSSLLEGFAALFTLEIGICILVGAAIGMLVGAFPGISATMAVALASAFTLTVEPLAGLAVLLTILIAAQFGDRVPAILINTPGTPASIATTFDGYSLAKQGKAGIALTTSAYASAIGGFVGIAVLMAVAIPLSTLALQFGSPEMFALVVFGLTMMIEVSGGKIVKGLIAGLFGLALGTVGRNPLDGSDRFTFDIPQLVEGIPFIAVIIGLFGITEVFSQMVERGHAKGVAITSFGRWWPNRQENRTMIKPVAIGSGVGTIVGILPAAGGDIGGIVAWDQARRFSKTPEQFGKGSLEGSLDRLGVALLERRRRSEQAGVGELEDGPQVGQPVLDRGAGHRDPGRRWDRADRRRLLGGGVLDRLGLVHHDPRPVDLAEVGRVPGGQRISGDDQVTAHDRLGERPAAGPFGAVVDVVTQVRGEARGLALPVADQGHGADQQGGAAVGLVGEQGEQLHRLAQAHVVGEHTADAGPAEEVQPGQTTRLVRAELAVEGLRWGDGFEPLLGPAR